MVGMRCYLALVALSLVALPGCIEGDFGNGDAVHQTVHQRIAVSPNAEVDVVNVSGFVNVIPWSRQSVDVVARKHGDDETQLQQTAIAITHDGNPASDVEIRTRYRHDYFFFGNSGASVDYTIHVPHDVDLRIENVSGDVRASGIAGRVTINEVSGDVDLARIDGDLRVHTVSGSVDASLLHMGNGRTVEVEAVSGSLHVAIPPGSGASVTADSISGSFDSDFNIPTHERTVGVSASGRIGNGSGSIDMHTISGSMTISKT